MKLFLSLAKSSLLILLLCCCNNTLFAQTPIAHYPFSGNANDAIGTNHGTVNGATLTTDRFGNANSAYQFDGVNDIINFANLATSQVDNFTVSAWVKSANLNQWGFILTNGFDNNSSANGWTLLQRSTAEIGGATGAYVSGHYPFASWLSIGQSINSTSTWYHLTLVRDNGVSKFYLNGTSNGQTNSATPITPTGSLAIGGSYPGANFFNGSIDEVKIYNTALTPTQVLQEYTSSAPTLIAHYPFTGNANDAIGTNHGTVNGATLTTDRFGIANSAYSFDGTSSYISTSNLATTQSDNWTMSAWVKPSSLNQIGVIMLNGNTTGVNDGYGLFQANGSSGSGNTLTGFHHTHGWVNSGGNFTNNNTWYHVVMERDNGVDKYFINGVQTPNTSTMSITNPVGSLIIGGLSNGFDMFQGAIDEVKIYNTPLTASEVLAEYNATAPTVANYGTAFNNSVNVNGTSDYITAPHNAAFNFGTGDFAIEFWHKSAPITGIQVFIDKRSDGCNDGQHWAIQKHNGGLRFYVNEPGPSAQQVNITNACDNSWHHIAFVRNGNSVRAYRDGLLVENLTTTTSPNVDNTSPLGIANGDCNYAYPRFAGYLDELRFWNTSRTQTEIAGNMNTELTGNESGLVAYYKMNENGQGQNITVANSAIATGSTLNGTTYGTTTTPIFSAGSVCDCVNENQTLTLTAPVGMVFNNIDFSSYGTPTGTCPNLTYSSCNATNSMSLAMSTFLNQNSGSIVANNATFGDPCLLSVKKLCVKASYASSAIAKSLHFDGGNDYVSLGNWGTMPNQGTIAFYMNAQAGGSYPNPFSTHGGGNAGFRIEKDPGSNSLGLISGNDGGGYSAFQFFPSTALVSNQWYHIAFSWDKTSNTIQGYVDGVQVFNSACTEWATNWPNVQIGHGYGNNRMWNGYLDEFVFYNNVLSPSDVNNLKTCSPTLPASNVLAYYNFNQGMDLASNSTVTTLIDATSNHNGTLNNFALTGATSNWSASTGGAITCTGITLSAGSIGSSQTICGNNPPALFSNTTSASITNNATISYQWQDSIVGGIWTNIAGANAATYQATNTAGVKYFRRKASALAFEAYSNVINLDITNTVGDPALFASNSWNVYCYNGYDVDLGSGVTYRGLYTVNTLDLNSTNEFATTSSPSSFSGYQGCSVPTDLFTWVYKRQGFPDGDYVMSSTGCDDVAKIYVNGNLVYNYVGFSAFNNISLGHLDANSTIEIRCADWSSSAYANFTFTTASFNGGTISGTQSNCGAYTPSLLGNLQSAYGGSNLTVSYQWQQSADGSNWFDLSSLNPTHQPDPITSTTYYRRRATNGINEQAYSNVVIATVTSSTWYADVDGDGFGDATNTLSSCTQPSGYIADNTDCNDNDPLQKPGQVWTIDNDEDDYAAGVTVTQCTRPLHGYLPTELIATAGDCNDNDANINPSRQYFSFTNSATYMSSVCQPLLSNSYQTYSFEVIYTNLNNVAPQVTFPRVYLDYEGNGVYNNVNDRTIILTPADNSDNNFADGKKYIGSINSLINGSNYQTSVQTSENNCATVFGPFNYPDVLELPDLEIFANDISFSSQNPMVGSPLTVSAIVHNASDYDAQNFVVHLINQYDPSIVYPAITINNLPAQNSQTVTWNIITPAVEAWCPMKVSVDYTNVITETNELDNYALRPFTNGNYNLPGGIVLESDVNPKVSQGGCATNTIYGHAHYTGTPVPLPDSSVAGALVTAFVVELGSTYSAYTNSAGDFAIVIPRPIIPMTYTVHLEITDFTFTAYDTTHFTVTTSGCLPDLSAYFIGESSVVNQNHVETIQVFVRNNGCAATTTSTTLSISSTIASNLPSSVTIPPLAVGAIHTVTLPNVQFNSVGVGGIFIQSDADNQITECDELNGDYFTYHVLAPLPDISIVYAGGNTYTCEDVFAVKLHNGGGVPTGAFNCTAYVYDANHINLLATIPFSVPNILNAPFTSYPYYDASVPFNFTTDGIYKIDVVADIYNDVAELNESNNGLMNGQANVGPCKPDLFIQQSCSSIQVNPSNPNYTGTDTIVATITNGGNADAVAPFIIDFALSGGLSYPYTCNTTLQPGQSIQVQQTVPAPPSGTQSIEMLVDASHVLNELSESNNEAEKSLCWDFAVVGNYCYPYNNFWNAGNYIKNQNIYLYCHVLNNEVFKAQNVPVRFEVSGPGLTGTINLGNAIVPSMPQSCGCPIQATLPTSFVFPEAGTYTFTMTIDPNNAYGECSELNNSLTVHVNVVELPDMRVTSQFINPSLLNPDPNQSITFDLTYENIGLSNINDIMGIKILVDEIPVDSIDNLNGLIFGDNNTVSIPTSWSSNLVGAHIVRSIIDYKHQVNESNEMNNEATRAIIVGSLANLQFRYLNIGNAIPALGNVIPINFRVRNDGDLPAEGDVVLSYFDDNQNNVQIANLHVNLQGNDSVTMTYFWTVQDANTVLSGLITNVTTNESVTDDNDITFAIGGFGISFTTTNSCSNHDNGIAIASGYGGVPPYSYSWSNGSIIDTAKNLAPGTYTVTVTDNTAFSVSTQVSIGTFAPIDQTYSVSGCDSLILPNGNVIFTNGTYTVMYPNVNGCDSVVHYIVTIHATSSTQISVSACNSYTWEGITYTSNATPTHVYTNTNGCDSVVTLQLNLLICSPLEVDALLSGYHKTGATMRTVLLNAGITNAMPHQTDSITVELHNASAPFSVVAVCKTIIDTLGNIPCLFENSFLGESYYLVIKHRSSIQTWSAAPVLFTANSQYNFTDAQQKAYGDNLLEVETGIFAIYCGDMNQDGFVDSFDYPLLDNDIFNGVNGVYVNTDLNGDGFVDSFDFPLFDINSFNGISVIRP